MAELAAVMGTRSRVLAAVLGLDLTVELQTLAVQVLVEMVEAASTTVHRSRVLVLLCGLGWTAEHQTRVAQVHVEMEELALTMEHRLPVLVLEDGEESTAQQYRIHANQKTRVFMVANVSPQALHLRAHAYQGGLEATVVQRSMYVSRAIHA